VALEGCLSVCHAESERLEENSMSDEWVLGILGGSGLYDIDGLDNPQWIEIALRR